MSRRARILLRTLAGLTILGGVAALALPWWLPAVATRLAPRFGASVGAWESRGWSGFVLRDVTYAAPGVRVAIDEVSLPVLGVHAFGWNARAADAPAVVPIVARGVVVTLTESEPLTGEAPAVSVHAILRSVLDAHTLLERWLLPARIADVVVHGGGEPIRLVSVAWDGATIDASGSVAPIDTPVELRARFSMGRSIDVRALAPSHDVQVDVTVTIDDEGVRADGRGTWKGNVATAHAVFATSGMVPRSGALDVPAFDFDAPAVGLAEYGAVQAMLRAAWDGAAFDVRATARAEPRSTGAGIPPLDIEIDAGGDLTALRVGALRIHAPGMDAHLSQPLRVALPAFMPDGPALVQVAVDLTRIPGAALQGAVSGEARVIVEPGADTPARVQFSVQGDALAWHEHAIRSVALDGGFDGRELDLESVEVEADEGSEVRGRVQIDFARRAVVAGEVKGAVTPAFVRRFAPDFPGFSSVQFTIEADGAFEQMRHSGRIVVGALEAWPGETVEGTVEWTGSGVDRARLTADVRTGSGVSLPLVADVTLDPAGVVAATVGSLAWNDGAGTWWTLQEPARLRIEPGEPLRISIDQARLGGESLRAAIAGSIQWPAHGRVSIEVEHLDAARLGLFLPVEFAAVTVAAANVEAAWDDGPVRSRGGARVAHAMASDLGYEAELEFATEAGAIHVSTVRVVDASGVVLAGTGRLPVIMEARATGWVVNVPEDGPLACTLTSVPNAEFWKSIERATGWTVGDPRIDVHLEGTLRAPRGRIVCAATTLALPAIGNGEIRLPRLTELSVVADATPEALVVSDARVTVDGSPIALRARAPWSLWDEWRDVAAFPWRKAELAVTARTLPVERAARYFPMELAPEGTLDVDLAHLPGSGYAGTVRLTGAALRPMQPLGTVRDIGAALRFDGYRVELVDAMCTIGGRPVTVQGRLDLTDPTTPAFAVHVQGTQVPIVREPGVVLRTSLDVHVASDGVRPARISGDAVLGQSVFVSDLASLIPVGGVATPERRPPYFSVEDEPFAAWVLDVDVRGDRFLRVENPFFKGTVSADFKLEGTLREPRLVGRATSADGTVRFPFANLQLEQMEVNLTPEQPYRPALIASGKARLFGYDVRMEASGPAEEPQLLFSSDPPLSSQDVFLMVTTGALPASGNSFSPTERARRLAIYLGRGVAEGLGLAGNGGDRLTVRTGENFSAQGRETVYIQYDLDGRWSVVGEYDRFDAYNGGIKFRIIDR